jgi:signal transduction histidine kinase
VFRAIRHSLIARVSLASLTTVALTVMLTGWALFWTFDQTAQRILDNHLMAYTDIILSRVEIDHEKVTLRDDAKLLAGLPRYWQLTADGQNIDKSDSLVQWLTPRPEDPGSVQRLRWVDAAGSAIIAVQTTFLFPGDKKITLICGLDAAVAEAYKAQERESLTAPLYRILLLAGVLLVGLNILLVYYALRPVAAIKTALRSVFAGNAQSIEGTWPHEISALTDEINRLLDYTSGSIARHREFSSNLAHSLKTPLTVIANESDIGAIKSRLRGLMEMVDRQLARAYAAGTSNILSAATPVLPVLRDIGEGFGKAYGKEVEIRYPDDILFKGDKADLYEVLGNIVENACKFCASRVLITNRGEAIVIEDDGTGIPEPRRVQVLQRGIRLDESKPGTGIGLAVAADIVALYRGDIRLDSSVLGGLAVFITLPVQR